MQRSVHILFTGEEITEGAGVRLLRLFGHDEAPKLDPFLLLDDFRSEVPEDYRRGFPWHPHRGIETITYILKGDVAHEDNLGNQGVISDGDVQWMTAGSGIIHQEMPKGDKNGVMHGFQLWTNLPATSKMMPPRYQGFTAREMPETRPNKGCRIRVIAGTLYGITGPVTGIVTDPLYCDCTLERGGTFQHDTAEGDTVLVYGIDGHGEIGGTRIENRELACLSPGDEIQIKAPYSPFRCLIMTGTPIGEPVAWRGPIVMNTQAELDQAFAEYRNGTFVQR